MNESTRKEEVKSNDAQILEIYSTLKDYEHHFNKMEFDVRKLASVWLLTVFGGIAYVVRGSVGDNPFIHAKFLIPLLCMLGSIGLFSLWIQDYVVYHGLMRAVFMMGLRFEFNYPNLPPLRSLMMTISGGSGMGPLMKFYYLIPMVTLVGIAFTACFKAGDYQLWVFPVVTAIFPFWIAIQANRIQKVTQRIAEKLGDSDNEEFSRMYDPNDTEYDFSRLLSRL